mgnify:CR=1 FL=1
MNKYLHVINIGIQNTLVYRMNFLFRSLFGLIPLFATISLWRTIYSGQAAGTDVGGYTLAEMISYYLVVTIVDAWLAGHLSRDAGNAVGFSIYISWLVWMIFTAVGAGATAVVQPGGSVRDPEVIQAANDKGVAMVFTGNRHFRH